MLIIADNRIPDQARSNLLRHGKVVWLKTSKVTEESISGHPDIFFCKTKRNLIVAPNLPDIYKESLSENKITFIEGLKAVDEQYPAAAAFNAVITDKYLIHKTDVTDEIVLNDCTEISHIHVNQGFTRCSLLPLKENHFITSDRGIFKILDDKGIQVLLVSADEILLPGHAHGFFGGACGVRENNIFIFGDLKHYPDGEKVRAFVSSLGYEIIELYDGPLFDGGSLLFISNDHS